MSALSKFMEALKQASSPQRPSEGGTGVENEFPEQAPASPFAEAAANFRSPNSASLLHHSPDQNQQNLRKQSEDSTDTTYQMSGAMIFSDRLNSVSGLSAGEPTARPPLPARDSLDDLFSDGESEEDDMLSGDVNNEEEYDNDDDKERTWASDRELLPTVVEGRPYNPNAPTQFFEDMKDPDFGSPQVSPETPFYPHQQPSLMKTQSKDGGYEIQSALSEEEQIAYFSDKAFRQALRDVEPSLSKEQQYYAWRSANENVNEESMDSTVDDADSKETAGTPDKNPPYQLGMEPVGFMDGVPIFADVNPTLAMREVHERVKQTNSGKHDLTEDEEEYEILSQDPLDGNADSRAFRPYNPFSTYHSTPAPTALRAEMAKREQMLESSFSEALQALEKDNAERLARESEIDEAHLGRIRALSQRRTWTVDQGNGIEEDDKHPSEESAPARGRQSSPEPSSARGRNEVHNITSPSKIQDESFATAFESPDKDGSDSVSVLNTTADTVFDPRQTYGRHRGEDLPPDEEHEPPSPSSRYIPGLDHLNPPPSPSHRTSPPPYPSTPRSPTSRRFDASIRKSIEPETPHHPLNRDCTPAFEDRSPSPSPRSVSNNAADTDMDMDMEIDEASPSRKSEPASRFDSGSPRPPFLPQSSFSAADITSSPRQLAPQQQPQDGNQPSPPIRGEETTPLPPPGPSTSTSNLPNNNISNNHPPLTSPPHPPKPKPKPSKPRRKSAIQGNGVKVAKSSAKTGKPLPKSRNVTTSIQRAAAKEVLDGRGRVGKVKEAVERIEASVLNGEGKKGRAETPPTRRSRRLMERRERETPTPTPTPTPEPV